MIIEDEDFVNSLTGAMGRGIKRVGELGWLRLRPNGNGKLDFVRNNSMGFYYFFGSKLLRQMVRQAGQCPNAPTRIYTH